MELVNCPLCREEVTVSSDGPVWFELRPEPVILRHTPGPQAVLDRREVRHIDSGLCLGSGCSLSLAEDIAADRAAGVPQRAHP